MGKLLLYITAFALLFVIPATFGPHIAAQQAFAQKVSPSATPTLTPSGKVEKLHQMDILMGEHAALAAQMIIARYDKRADYSAAKKAVDNNSKLRAQGVESFYGQEARQQFETIWNRHINAFLLYADAKKSGDKTKETEAISQLQSFTEDVTNLLVGSQDRTLFYESAQDYFTQHIQVEKAILDAYAAKNYTQMYSRMHQAYMHATSLSLTFRR